MAVVSGDIARSPQRQAGARIVAGFGVRRRRRNSSRSTKATVIRSPTQGVDEKADILEDELPDHLTKSA
jgi:hypothetical protein